MASNRHNALVVPLSDGYAVSCACEWAGRTHDTPGPAEQEAKEHEAHPAKTDSLRREA